MAALTTLWEVPIIYLQKISNLESLLNFWFPCNIITLKFKDCSSLKKKVRFLFSSLSPLTYSSSNYNFCFVLKKITCSYHCYYILLYPNDFNCHKIVDQVLCNSSTGASLPSMMVSRLCVLLPTLFYMLWNPLFNCDLLRILHRLQKKLALFLFIEFDHA